MARVYLGLGSNLGDRLALLRAALDALRGSAGVRFVDASPLYESEPWEDEPGRAAPGQPRPTDLTPGPGRSVTTYRRGASGGT